MCFFVAGLCWLILLVCAAILCESIDCPGVCLDSSTSTLHVCLDVLVHVSCMGMVTVLVACGCQQFSVKALHPPSLRIVA